MLVVPKMFWFHIYIYVLIISCDLNRPMTWERCLEEAWKNWINWDAPFKSESDPCFFYGETDAIRFEKVSL